MKYAVALGNFDGVHRAHTELIKSLVNYAQAKDIRSALYTFDRHPKDLLCSEGIKSITQNKVKKEIILDLGVDEVYFETLTPDLLNTEPESFVRDILLQRFDIAAVFAGFDYHFGHRGTAGVGKLKRFGKKYGFDTLITEEIKLDGVTISSSAVRRALILGDIESTNRLLGRAYSLKGQVMHGKELGRTIGFPTLNIEIGENMLPPKKGVYVSRTNIGGTPYKSVTNIGTNPTVEKAAVRAETHVFGFDSYIYGSAIQVFLLHRIRDEKRFMSVDELKAQITADTLYAKEYFQQYPL